MPTPEAEEPAPVEPAPRPPKRRQPIPGALKAIAGLVVLAIVFIVAAILGGGAANRASKHRRRSARRPAPLPKRPPPQRRKQLGYPAFATANTTRVGGNDPASNAAGVALAVYPSSKPSQRPAAVTLADADDWRTAIAAAVLAAPPLGAPLLLSEADGMPDASGEALAALDPAGSRDTGGAQAFATVTADVPGGLKTRRVRAGGVAGAAAIAALREKLAGRPPRHIVVASTANPAFAMPAAAWAARSGDPVLFTGPNDLAKPTARALKAHPQTPVYVLGPSSAISSSVVREIAELGPRVRRVAGEDPVANAVEMARYDDGGFGWNINDPGHGFVVARSEDPLDAAAAAALSASGNWGPLLLTDTPILFPRRCAVTCSMSSPATRTTRRAPSTTTSG